jgi:hypothetical protein
MQIHSHKKIKEKVVLKAKGIFNSALTKEISGSKKMPWTTKDFKNLLLMLEVNLLIEVMMIGLPKITMEKEEEENLEVLITPTSNREIKVEISEEVAKADLADLAVRKEMIIKRGEMKMRKLNMAKIPKFQR